ncbi:hypothetical protein J2T57_002607 [Natronocella acetinitrilica]|uniref:Uncharacterized protein n=1 Tax=Natronocella acetinitrilica TaxID=414046 RepID=A0AAE3KGP8_9GAMM|nr:hypothetical protein [Natronocella acetinitrilica]MCP1675457.1 hypothetical protein [Natronocella acetinitrilica]
MDPVDGEAPNTMFSNAVYWAGAGIFLALVAGKFYIWMRSGYFPMPTLGDGLAYFGYSYPGANDPADWHGLAAVGRWILSIPLMVAVAAAGLVAGFFAEVLEDAA